MRIPEALKKGPFTLAQAREAGLERWHLRGTSWRRVGPATYMSAAVADSPMQQLRAAQLRLPAVAAFSGMTAAWLHGLDVEPCHPVEATVPTERKLAGMSVRRASLDERDVVTVRGLRVTSIVRTLADLCLQTNLVEAVVLLDMALHARLTTVADVASWAAGHSARPGIRRLRRALELADGAAESPMESRLRMLLVLARLPRPQVQVPIHNQYGRFSGRVDLYYERCRLGIEYDGAQHRESITYDDRRQNRLLDAGIRLLRFTASDVFNDPGAIVAQVRQQLRAVGTNGVVQARLRGAIGTKRTKDQMKTIAS